MAVNVNGGALEFSAVINAGQFNAAIASIEKQLNGLTKKADEEARSVENLVKKTTLAIGAYASLATASNFIGDIVRVRGEFQQLEVAFRTMLKNKGAADKLLAEATTLAAKTPFTLQEVGSSAKQLLAYGFAADNITKNIEMLGNVASGVGAPLGDIVYLYGTLRTQGKAMTKDIREFTGRGIPIVAELAKQFGVAEDKVMGMVEAGKVGFPEVERAFKSMTGESGLFFNLMQEQSKTLTGLVSNLQDAWSRMLNDIGKSNEGIFAGAIKGAISVVDNYKDVLDIIKVLIATYGTYRAAIIITNTVTAISTSLTKGWTIAEILRFKAMQASAAAMKILNATMLSNPAVAFATGIALLVSAMLVFRKTTDNAAEAQKRMNNIQVEAQRSIDGEKTKLIELLKVAKDETKSKVDREAAIRKINQISPEYLGNITLENIKTKETTAAIEQYIKVLERKAQAQAAENALTEISQKQFDAQIELSDKIDKRRRSIGFGQLKGKDGKLISAGTFDNDAIIKEMKASFDEQNKGLEQQKETIKNTYSEVLTQQLLGEKSKQGEIKRTVAIIEEEIKAIKEQQSSLSTNAKQFQDFQKSINKLEAEKKRITGDKNGTKQVETEYNKQLDALKQLLQDITSAESDARQSGMLKEQSEIDKINERYDQLKKRAAELKAGEGVLQRIEKARVQQVGNVKEKEAFELYKKSLQDQKELFNQFEQYKVTLGEEKSRELLNIQKTDAVDYVAFLKSEILKIYRSGDSQSLSGKLKIQLLTDQVIEAEKRQAQQLIDDQAKAFEEMLAATFSFKDKEKEINDRYNKLEKSLADDGTIQNKQERFAILKQSREEELKQLEIDAFKQSAIYRKLNEDITLFSRQRIKELIKDLQELLKNTAGLSPIVKKQIEDQIKSLQQVLKDTSDTKKFQEIAGAIATSLGTIGSSLTGVNKELGETVSQLGDMVNVALDAANAFSSFSTGDIAGGIGSIVSALTKIIDGFAKGAQSKKDAFQQIVDFQNAIANSEAEINLLYRERQREQIRLNKLKLEGIQAERKLLEDQKKANASAYADLLAKIQKESFISGKSTSKKFTLASALGGVLGILSGGRTQVTDILSSLSGKSFADLEKLFNSGQLTDRAKELFLQLQKIKQEGVDIDALLIQNAEEMKQLFTGTTADNITDSIADGFKNGKRSAADFADDFENLMRNAIIESLKMKALEGPLKEFYDQFAAFSQSDGILTAQEIEQLRNNFAGIIKSAGDQFDQLQQITNIGFNANGGGGGNSLTGAIKGITETQANLLAGQFGGLRLTAMDILSVSRTQLEIQNKIQVNTGLSAERMAVVIERMQYYYETVGVKIR